MGQWNGIGKSWIEGPLEHGKKICSSFKSNEVIKIKSNRKSRNKSEKFSKKESSKIQGFTNLPASGFPPFVGEPQVEGVMQCSSEFPSVKIPRFVSRRTPDMISRCQRRD